MGNYRRANLVPDLSGITAAEWSFFAGLIEGEGCITINTNNTPSARATGKPKYRHMTVTFGNTDELLVQWVRTRFGGGLGILNRTRLTHKYDYKAVYQVAWRNHNGRQILEGILPYMVSVKKQRAEIALEFASRIRTKHGGPPLGADEIASREIIYDRMRQTYGDTIHGTRAARQARAN